MAQVIMQLQQFISTLKREEGQDFAEYALIFALVVIIAAAGLTPLGAAILAQFDAVTALL